MTADGVVAADERAGDAPGARGAEPAQTGLALVPGPASALARATIAAHSKSFSLASRLLRPGVRDEAVVLYTWCRRTDDAVDTAATGAPGAPAEAVARLRDELDALYGGAAQPDPVLAAFQDMVVRRAMPRAYPDELIAGMEMDALGVRYETLASLEHYCWRVAGVVGLMMCHVLGVRDPAARRHAVHLGMAMQLTNVCRDVVEDWALGRLYLPDDLLAEAGAGDLRARLGGPFPEEARDPARAVVRALLQRAAALYRSGARGLPALDWRSALAVRTARHVYARIGGVLAERGHDVLSGRAVVPRWHKLLLVGRALVESGLEAPRRAFRPFHPAPLAAAGLVRYPDDVLPV